MDIHFTQLQTSKFFEFSDQVDEDENIEVVLRSAENILKEDIEDDIQYYMEQKLQKQSSTQIHALTDTPDSGSTSFENNRYSDWINYPISGSISASSSSICNNSNNNNLNNEAQLLPYLKLQIIFLGKQEYELDEKDIKDLFERYGAITKVIVQPKGIAYIVFNDVNSAFVAQNSLDEYLLKDFEIQLQVKWCASHEYNFINVALVKECFDKSKNNTPNKDEYNRMGKHTCRYQIQIDNDKEFQVARKIIGSQGYNMKRIVEACGNQKLGKQQQQQYNDTVKLRLRGRGSGFKEGPNKKESNEPLHLCVSCKSQEVFSQACQQVEELLNNIYSEYKQYCIRVGKQFDTSLKAQKLLPNSYNNNNNQDIPGNSKYPQNQRTQNKNNNNNNIFYRYNRISNFSLFGSDEEDSNIFGESFLNYDMWKN